MLGGILSLQKLEETLLYSDGSSGERSLTLQGDVEESGAAPIPISSRICQIITRHLAEQPAGTRASFICHSQTKALTICSIRYTSDTTISGIITFKA